MQLIKQILSLQIVMTLSIGLLLFIGIGESYRVVPSLLLTDVCNQSQLLKSSIENNLKLGIPVEFKGFRQQANMLVSQSDQIVNAKIIINQKQEAFSNSETNNETLTLTCDMTDKDLLRILPIDWEGLLHDSTLDKQYAINLGLSDKISQVALLAISPTPGLFSDTINKQFRPVLILSFILIVLMPVLITISQKLSRKHPKLIQQSLYHLTFVAVGALMISVLITLCAQGIKAQSSSLANSLASRLNVPLKLGFDLENDLNGFSELLGEYRIKNPDISHIYLLRNGKLLRGSTSEGDMEKAAGQERLNCSPSQSQLGDSKSITTCLQLQGADYQILVKTPWSKVYVKLWRATRNLLVLFIASALLSNMFLAILLSMQQEWRDKGQDKINRKQQSDDQRADLLHKLQLIRPVFVLGVLMEAINLSFFPTYLAERFANSDFSVSTVFGVYFISFAITLIPAGRWAEKHSLRNMMLAGIVFSLIGIGGLVYTQDPNIIIFLRALSGIGQGILFIAVQSYLLSIESKQPGLRGVQQLVIGFNVSALSGMTIGALLMPILGEQSVFLVCAIIGLICLVYCAGLIRDVQSEPQTSSGPAVTLDKPDPFFKLKKLLTDFEFYKSILLIGFPTKAIYVGVLVFIMPILLKELGFDTDVIGQILVFYYLGVLLSTAMIPKLSSRIKSDKLLLFFGCIGGGLGLVIMGYLQWLTELQYVASLSQQGQDMVVLAAMLGGVWIIGLAHGLINSPIVSYVVKSKNAQQIGKATTAATYRFLERLGHAGGPLLAGIILLKHDGSISITSLGILGWVIIIFGMLFITLSFSSNRSKPQTARIQA